MVCNKKEITNMCLKQNKLMNWLCKIADNLKCKKTKTDVNEEVNPQFPQDIFNKYSLFLKGKDDHSIVLNFKKFLEVSFPCIYEIAGDMYDSIDSDELWDAFTEANYKTLVYDTFSMKYSKYFMSSHRYGFSLHCYRKITHIECFINVDLIEAISLYTDDTIKLTAGDFESIGLAFIKFWPEIDDDNELKHNYIEVQIFDRATGYIFTEKKFQNLLIPINDSIRLELCIEDYDENEHETYKIEKSLDPQKNQALKNK